MGIYDDSDDTWIFTCPFCGKDNEVDDADTDVKGVITCCWCDSDFRFDKTKTDAFDRAKEERIRALVSRDRGEDEY